MIALCQCARIELCAIEVSLEDEVNTIVTQNKLANNFTLQFLILRLQTDRVRNELPTRLVWSL